MLAKLTVNLFREFPNPQPFVTYLNIYRVLPTMAASVRVRSMCEEEGSVWHDGYITYLCVFAMFVKGTGQEVTLIMVM